MPIVTSEQIEEIRTKWMNRTGAFEFYSGAQDDILTLLQYIDKQRQGIAAATEQLLFSASVILQLREDAARKEAYYAERNAINERGIDNEGRRT